MAKYICPGCGYQYNEVLGEPREGYAPSTAFSDLPEEFVCPDCAVRAKEDFELVEE
ncbi:rubredoxin [Pseudomonas leptonychotis]|uniref:rubredoxin n=1 Tax=Pseudomonas leptonychotis TaxID=2448482 RepID=UPI0039F0DE03